MAYRLAGIERNVVVSVLEDWLNSDKELSWLLIESLRGKGRSITSTKRGEYDRTTIDNVPSAEFLLDDILDTYADFGQRLQLRAVFKDEQGEDDWEHTQTKRLNLVPEPVGARTGSRGPDVATERLSESLSKGFDTLVQRNEDATQRTLDVLQQNGSQVEKWFEKLLEYQAVAGNTSTEQAIALATQSARAEMAEFQLEMVIAQQETSLGTVLIEAMPILLQSPIVANLAELISAFAKSLNSPAPQSTGAPAPPKIAEPPAEEPPSPPA